MIDTFLHILGICPDHAAHPDLLEILVGGMIADVRVVWWWVWNKVN